MKNCIYCQSAQDTAKLWKLKCTQGKNKFVENVNIAIIGEVDSKTEKVTYYK